jgi:hypothetical protein
MKMQSPKYKAKEIDNFSSLSNKQLKDLSDKWENEAVIFETRFDYYLKGPYTNTEKTDKLFEIANRLWQKLRNLERWRLKNDKNVRQIK